MQKFNGSLIRQFPALETTGNAAVGVQVTVFLSGTSTKATLYATNNVAGARLDNPLTTDSMGFYSFYAADGAYRLVFSDSRYTPLEVQLVDAINLVNAFNTAIDATGYVLVDNAFSAGYTVTQRNEALLDGGVYYVWKGALPKVITAGSSVATTGGIGNGAWQAVLDNTLEQRLEAGTAPIGSVTAGDVSGLVEGIAAGTADIGNAKASDLAKATINVPNLKALAAIPLAERRADVIYHAMEFNNNTNIGGFGLRFDADYEWTSDDIGLVYPDAALNAWNGTAAGIATLYGDYGSGGGAWVRVNTGSVTPAEFGAVVGVESSIAFNVAASTGIKLANDAPLLYADTLYIKSDYEGSAPLIRSGNADIRVVIEANNPKVALDVLPSQMALFVEGSTKTGFAGLKVGDVLIFNSTEELIKRHEAVGVYTKNEAFVVTNEDGTVSPSFDCTYTDITQLQVFVKRKEKSTVVDGLRIEQGDSNPTFHGTLIVRRSNVTINDIGIVLDRDFSKGLTAVQVEEAANVTFNNGLIANYRDTTQGYGINVRNSSFVYVNKLKSSNCRRNLAGRHMNQVFIDGVNFASSASGPISSHWGNGVSIKNSTFDCGGGAILSAAGSNFTVVNNSAKDCFSALYFRGDTPSVGGKVVIYDNYVGFRNGIGFLFGWIDETKDYGDFFGQVLKRPRFLSIKNNRSELFSNIAGVMFTGNGIYEYPEEALGYVEIENNQRVDALDLRFQLWVHISKLVYHDQVVGRTKEIKISNQHSDFIASTGPSRSVPMKIENRTDSSKIDRISISDCTGFGFRVSTDCTNEFTIKNTDVHYVAGFYSGAVAKPLTFNIDAVSCNFYGLMHPTCNKFIFRTCYFKEGFNLVFGDPDNANQTFNDSIDMSVASQGCFADIAVDSADLPFLNSFGDSSKYITLTLPTKTGDNFGQWSLRPNGIGLRTDTNELQVYVNGVMKKVQLVD